MMTATILWHSGRGRCYLRKCRAARVLDSIANLPPNAFVTTIYCGDDTYRLEVKVGGLS